MSADKDGPRDWDKELAEIDKLIASGAGSAPPAPASVPAKKGGAAPRQTGGGEGGGGGGKGAGRLAAMRHTPFFTWVRLILALALGIGMTQWPYTHGCGLQLYAYLGGVATVIAASFWSLVSSWHSRSGLAHALSLVLLFWGAGLAAREVLPRVGYARAAATWECSAAPAGAARPANPAPQQVPATAEPAAPGSTPTAPASRPPAQTP